MTQVGADDHIRIIMISFPVTLFRPQVIQCFPPPPYFASSLQLLGQLERTGSRPADKEMISFLPAIHVPSEQAAEFPSSPESSHRPPCFMWWRSTHIFLDILPEGIFQLPTDFWRAVGIILQHMTGWYSRNYWSTIYTVSAETYTVRGRNVRSGLAKSFKGKNALQEH